MDTEKPIQNSLLRIRSFYSQYTDKEKLVADYILADPSKIIHSTISQVGDDLHIADATIFRFCKRIGFKGYQALKIALASEMVAPVKDIHETIDENDSDEEIAKKVFKSNIRTLEETINTIDETMYSKAVAAILSASRVEFYGNGGSGFVAMDAHHKFLRTGIPTVAYNDSHMQLTSASQLTSEDVIVLISHSGANKDILQVVDVAKENAVKTIGITNFAKSPLSKKVDIPLYTVSLETEYRSEALASRIGQLSMIDSLYVNVMLKRKEEVQLSLQKMRNAISLKRI